MNTKAKLPAWAILPMVVIALCCLVDLVAMVYRIAGGKTMLTQFLLSFALTLMIASNAYMQLRMSHKKNALGGLLLAIGSLLISAFYVLDWRNISVSNTLMVSVAAVVLILLFSGLAMMIVETRQLIKARKSLLS